MLKPAEVTRQIIASRVALGDLRRALDDGVHRPELHRIMRAEVDTLTCLIDESTESVHWKIKSLIYEFEEIGKKLVN